MTYASNLTTGIGTSQRDYSVQVRAPRRDRDLNVGYALFASGALWIVAIAAWMIGGTMPLPQCQYNAAGDAVLCGASASIETPALDTRAGLNVSGMAIPAGLSGSGYDAF